MNDKLICNNAVVKIASRCNLNCSYCYMYNGGDETWKKQPKVMSKKTIIDLGRAIKEHCIKNKKPSFNIILHGGEPLLAGTSFFEMFVETINGIVNPVGINISYALQTNGTLLTEEWCTLFQKLHIVVGISIDGMKKDNDMYRVYHSGKGSYDDIVKGLKVLQNSKTYKLKPGILGVVNIMANPIETYQHLKSLGVVHMDFLLPDANYSTPPPKGDPNSATPYADWLIKIFDIWFEEDSQTKITIRFFKQIMQLIMGEDFGFETAGTGLNDAIVVETDGNLEATDTLRICGDGFTKAGANVSTHSFDEALETPLTKIYVNAHKMLANKCIICPINDVCGGGSIQTRYSKINGFNNPSIYCLDLMKLITHIQNKIINSLPEKLKMEMEMEILTYDEVARYTELNQYNEVIQQNEAFLASF